MINLLKYEFKKTLFGKLIMLGITAIAEIMFLYGVFTKSDKWTTGGITFLIVCALTGLFYIGIETLTTFHKDLNTKQSYMLFLTPNRSHKILGAKVLENAVSILMTGGFFAALTAIDVMLMLTYTNGLEELLKVLNNMLSSILNYNIDWSTAVMLFVSVILSWLMAISTGYLAIVLCATVLAGKKISGLASFALFVFLNYVITRFSDLIVGRITGYSKMGLMFGVSAAVIAVLYFLTAWIMDKKLSV